MSTCADISLRVSHYCPIQGRKMQVPLLCLLVPASFSRIGTAISPFGFGASLSLGKIADDRRGFYRD